MSLPDSNIKKIKHWTTSLEQHLIALQHWQEHEEDITFILDAIGADITLIKFNLDAIKEEHKI